MYKVSCHLISAKMLSTPKQRYCFQWTASSPVLCLVSCRSTCMLRWENCLCRKQFINERNAETAQSEVIDMGKSNPTFFLPILRSGLIWALNADQWRIKEASESIWLAKCSHNSSCQVCTEREIYIMCGFQGTVLEQILRFFQGESRIWPNLAQWTWTLADYHKGWW